MATHTHHYRNPSQPKRPQPPHHHARSSRPPVSKRHSNHGVPKSKSVQIKAEEHGDDIMAASFPQYCTYCEKQIVVPSNSILYCSESCRKKDNNKALSYSLLPDTTPPMTPLHTVSFDDFPPARDIIPQRSPTALNTNTHRFSTYSEHSEEDSSMHSEDERRRDSEAARYLRQFHQATESSEPSSRTPRPRYNRSSASLAGLSTGAPSLSHSPSGSVDAMSLPMPYTPSTRPLPPRANPFSSSYGARSIDLVNPFAIAAPTHTAPSSLQQSAYSLKSRPVSQMSMGIAEGELLYEKTAISPSPTTGSLKQLFRFSNMQAPPSYSRYQ